MVEEGLPESAIVSELQNKYNGIKKNIDELKQENQLFESYIQRQIKDDPKLEDQINEMQQKGRKGKGQQKKDKYDVPLNAEDKYVIANSELDSLNKNIEEGREKSEELLDNLQAIIQGTKEYISGIKREAFNFKRDIVFGAENERTGKVIAEKLIKYMEENLKEKEKTFDKLDKKNDQLKKQIAKLEGQIKKKEEEGDGLKYIDFHQLDIENRKHVKEIDERNKKLLELKNTSSTVQENLKKLKDELEAQKKLIDKETKGLEEKKKTLSKVEEQTQKVFVEATKIKNESKQLERKQRRNQNLVKERDYINVKKEIFSQVSELNHIERSIKILEEQARRKGIVVDRKIEAE